MLTAVALLVKPVLAEGIYRLVSLVIQYPDEVSGLGAITESGTFPPIREAPCSLTFSCGILSRL